jgi:hypothetical protein
MKKMNKLTAKEIKKIYVQSVRFNNQQESHLKARSMGVIVPVYSHRNVELIDYCNKNIYKGNTTKDRMNKIYGVESETQSEFLDKVLKKHTIESVQERYDIECVKAREVIEKIYEQHIDVLNEIYSNS